MARTCARNSVGLAAIDLSKPCGVQSAISSNTERTSGDPGEVQVNRTRKSVKVHQNHWVCAHAAPLGENHTTALSGLCGETHLD